MATTRIRGISQIQPDSIIDAEINSAAAIQTSKLADNSKFIFNDGTRSFTAPVSGIAPTAPNHLTTKAYVDSVKQSLDIKDSVRVVTVDPVVLVGGAPLIVDGVQLVAGNRVLVIANTLSQENGIYVVQTLGTGSDGTWVRALDADSDADVTSGMYTFVESGVLNGSNGFVLTTADPIVLNGTPLSFVQFSGAGQITAGAGMTKSANTLNVVSAGVDRIVVLADSIDLAVTGIAVGTYKSVTTDIYGRVTAGTNPTTLAGFGITDAQALDSDLTALAALTTTGLISRTGNGSASTVTLAQPSTGLTITNADGVAGNPTFTLANDLAALEGFNGVGIAVRTGPDTWAQRSVDGVVDQIVITNVDGVAGNPTVGLAVSGIAAGTYKSITVDTYGRATAGTNPTTLAGYGITDAVNKTGDTMTGFLTLNADPTNALHAATKQYVDALQQALDLKQSVVAATTGANIVLVGGTPNIIDGVTLALGNRILVKDQTTASQNGIYTVQTLGTGANGTWVRAIDADTSAKVTSGLYTFIEGGVINGTSGWVLTTSTVITLDTTDLAFTQFSGAGQIIAGQGITKSGNQLDVNSANAGITVNTDNIALTLSGTTLTIDGSGLKLSDLANGKVLIGSSLNVATAQTLSGDVTISNAGVVTLISNVMRTTNYIVRETPAGAIDGVNTTFTLAATPVVGTEMIFANGLLLEPGAGNDYTIAGGTITMLFSLQSGDRLKCTYMRP